MKCVQITIDEQLAEEIDRAAADLGTTPSEFALDAVQTAIARVREAALERKHREGYQRHPPEPGEFDDWEDEQVWGDA